MSGDLFCTLSCDVQSGAATEENVRKTKFLILTGPGDRRRACHRGHVGKHQRHQQAGVGAEAARTMALTEVSVGNAGQGEQFRLALGYTGGLQLLGSWP